MQSAEQPTDLVQGMRPGLGSRVQKSWVRPVTRFARKKPLGAIGAAILLLLVVVAVFADQLATHDHLGANYEADGSPKRLMAPSIEFWFGTDTVARDLYSRVLHGARISLYVGLLSVTIGTVFGLLVGTASGYLGGALDLAVQRVVDAMLGFPGLVLAMVMVVALGASINNVTFAIAIGLIPRMTRLARSTTLSIKEEVYVLAAQAIGGGRWRIMLRHVMPNGLAPIFVVATGALGSAIVAEAGLSFLGLGVPPPAPSWGGILNVGSRGYMEAAPWLVIFPGVALSAVVFAFALFGDALRDVLDPRLRGT